MAHSGTLLLVLCSCAHITSAPSGVEPNPQTVTVPTHDGALLPPYPKAFSRGFHLGFAKGFRDGQVGPIQLPSPEREEKLSKALMSRTAMQSAASGMLPEFVEPYDALWKKLQKLSPQRASQFPDGATVAAEAMDQPSTFNSPPT